MNLVQSLAIALSMLRANKARSFLTMLGIIIGVMGVSLTVEMVEGFRSYMDKEFSNLGANIIFVFFDPGQRRRGEWVYVEGLKLSDVEAIRTECSLLQEVSGEMDQGMQTVSRLDQDLTNVDVLGIENQYLDLRSFNLEHGRNFDDTDIAQWSNNAIIGSEVAAKLFPQGDAVGNLITVQGRALRVIGVLEKKGNTLGMTEDKKVMVPLATIQKRWLGTDRVGTIYGRPRSIQDTDAAMDQMWECLMRHHDNRSVFRVMSQEQMVKSFGTIINISGIVFAGVAALALLVGGIGIMNIMLVSVTERTREIGLRMALGAKRFELLFQFLVEAGTLSLIGGLVGMGLAYAIGQSVDSFTHGPIWEGKAAINMAFPVWAAVGAALFSASVGMIFGLYPAWRAARLDPIEALRHE